jgi:hypothetical protein
LYYAFETWSGPTEPANSEPAAPESGIAEPSLSSLAEELRSLEESLSFDLDEVFANYHPDLADHALAEDQSPLADTVSNEGQWDELARLVADHVLVYMQEMQHPLQTELAKMRRTADEYYRDNRAMAVQVRQLLDEREQMLRALGSYEMELSRYRNLMGNLYLRH